MLGGGGEAGADEESAECVAIQAHDVRLVVEARSADVHGGRVVEEALFLGVAVEARNRAEAAGDCGPGATTGFKISSEALDVHPAHREQS